jgi:hypothetical protein
MKENYFFVFQKREREKKGPSSQRGAHTECNHSSKKKEKKKKNSDSDELQQRAI